MLEDRIGGDGRAVGELGDRSARATRFLKARSRGRQLVRPDAALIAQCDHLGKRAAHIGGESNMALGVFHRIWRKRAAFAVA